MPGFHCRTGCDPASLRCGLRHGVFAWAAGISLLCCSFFWAESTDAARAATVLTCLQLGQLNIATVTHVSSTELMLFRDMLSNKRPGKSTHNDTSTHHKRCAFCRTPSRTSRSSMDRNSALDKSSVLLFSAASVASLGPSVQAVMTEVLRSVLPQASCR